MTSRNIFVIGATGKVGSAAIQQLAKHSHINIHAGVRDVHKASTLKNHGVNLIHMDLDKPDSILSAFEDMHGLLLLTGYSVDMLKQSKRVIDAAKKAGVDHIVHIGASGNDTAEVAHWGWHKMIEAYIEQQGFNYTHLQPEAFMQNITAFGWLENNRVTNLIKDAVWSWVDANDVGALAGEALARPEKFRSQVWRLGYDAADIKSVAKMLSKKMQKDIQLLDLDPSAFYDAAINAGADPAYMSCIRDQFILNGQNAIANADTTFDENAFLKAVGRLPNKWGSYIEREFS
ncbi:MAG: NmrA family NAD(P)-binding protein [Pseudomonadota bacterium]